MDDCVREDVLRKFFQERRSEVRKAMQLDFMWERREEVYAISDLEALRRLHKLVARAGSVGEFERVMEDILEIAKQ